MNQIDHIHWAIEDFIDYIAIERGLAARTIEEYRYDLDMFFRYIADMKGQLVGEVDLTSIDSRDIRRFLKYVKVERSNTNRSLNRKIVTLRGFFQFHSDEEEGILERNPTRKLKNMKIENKLPVYLSAAESEELLNAVKTRGIWPARDYCIILTFLLCGCRAAELTALNLQDVLFDEDMIRFYGKGKKERLVPMLERTRHAITEYLAEREPKRPTDALFLTKKGRPLTGGGLTDLFTELVSRWPNRKPGVTLHKLRHTCLTLLMQSGVDIRTIQEIAGHSNIASTQIYTHVSKQELVKKMQVHPLA